MISRNEVTWAVPNVPLLLHGNSAQLLEAINESVEKKIDKLKEEKKWIVCWSNVGNLTCIDIFFMWAIPPFLYQNLFFRCILFGIFICFCQGESEFFTCLSDGKEIPSRWLNDRYCDCADCSDESETHVGNFGYFEWPNEFAIHG